MAKLLPPLVSEEQENDAQSRNFEHAGRANTLRNIGLVFGREYRNQVKRRSFIVTSIIYLLGIIIASFVPTIIQYIGAHSNSQTHLVVIDRAGSVAGMNGAALIHYMETALNGQSNQAANVVVTSAPETALRATQNAVNSGQFNALLVIDRAADQEIDFTYYTASSSSEASGTAQVQTMASQLNVLDRAERQHLSPAQISSLFAQPHFAVTSLQQDQSGRSTAEFVTDLILAYLGIILIFMANMIYGSSVAQGVAEEKGNRIMELLMLAATPFQLMAGKILGIGAAGLTQMGALVLVGIGMLALQNPLHAALLGNTSGGLILNITGASITMLLLVLLYFILSFALYASLYAAAGALVQRQDESQHVSTPVTMLFMVGYILSLTIVSIPGVPDALWFKVLTYVPFWTPTTMMVRIGLGTVAWWEILITVGLMGLAFLGCAWVSARIYRYGVLSYGQRFRMSQLLKVVRAS